MVTATEVQFAERLKREGWLPATKATALRDAALSFRAAMLDSGALSLVPQDKYLSQLRALETALANLSG